MFQHRAKFLSSGMKSGFIRKEGAVMKLIQWTILMLMYCGIAVGIVIAIAAS